MKKFYITTAIDYVHDLPHLGHAYEKIGADTIARFKRLDGHDVFFLIGNDEHSQNVKKKADSLGIDPKKYCDDVAAKIKSIWERLHISNDFFIQTTDKNHESTVRDFMQRVYESGDIYEGTYDGHYCVSCENFIQEKDLDDGKCPTHKLKTTWIKEQNYFFKLSKYQDELFKIINENPRFILPETRKNEVLKFMEEGLSDISISRASTSWGVKLPFDENCVAYVWVDALINYLSGLNGIAADKYKKFWPADLHVIGKDIIRFHCVIWPALLLSAKLPIPKTIWSHGFISLKGEKMSKTRGIVIDPLTICEKYGVDTLRYFLMREIMWDRDGDFSIERLTERYNADLANNLGNLVNRVLAMCTRYFNGVIENKSGNYNELREKTKVAILNYVDRMNTYSISEALASLWELVDFSNVYINDKKPWTLAKKNEMDNLMGLLYYLVEAIRVISFCLYPVMPEKSKEILSMICEGECLKTQNFERLQRIGEYKTKYTITGVHQIFPRMEV